MGTSRLPFRSCTSLHLGRRTDRRRSRQLSNVPAGRLTGVDARVAVIPCPTESRMCSWVRLPWQVPPDVAQLICSDRAVKGQGEAPSGLVGLTAPRLVLVRLVAQRVLATRGSRLICAGWVPQDGVRLERSASLGSSVTSWCSWLIVQSRVGSSRCTRPAWPRPSLLGGGLLQGGQGPAPAGELAGDGGVGHGVLLAPCGVPGPLVVQPLVAGVATDAGRGGGLVPAGLEDLAYLVLRLVVPGGLDQEPAGVGVPGLGDRALPAGLTGGVLGGDEPEVGADARRR